MKKYLLFSLLFGFALGYLTFITLDEVSPSTLSNELLLHTYHSSEVAHVPHLMTEVQSEQIPQLSVKVVPDMKSGYNLHLQTEHFTFVPDRANSEPIQNEGHAHLYINNEKVARLYGPWFHLDDHHLTEGVNVMRVTLNAHDHSEWAINQQPIEVVTELMYEAR